MNACGGQLADGVPFGEALASAIRRSASLATLKLSSNNLGDGETGFVDAADVSGASREEGASVVYGGRSLVVTRVGGAELCMRPAVAELRGLRAIADAMCASASLTSIDLAENQLGAEGGRVVAAALATGSSRLRRVDLRENYLDEGFALDSRGRLQTTSHPDVEEALRAAATAAGAAAGREPPCEVLV